MTQQTRRKWITPRRIQIALLLCLAGLGLRRMTMATNGTSSPTESYPLVTTVRDFSPLQSDFNIAAGDTLVQSVGNVAVSLNANGLPVYQGGGVAVTRPATDKNGRPILPAIAASAPVTNFTISGASVTSNQPMHAKVTVVGSAIASGSTPCPVTARFNVGSTKFSPFGAFDDPVGGNLNDNANPRSSVLPCVIPAGAAITVDGHSFLPGSPPSSYMTVNSSSRGEQVKALRNGDSPPNTAGFQGQVSAKAMLENYLDANTGKVKLANNQIIYLFELGTTDTKSGAFDMQDLVVVIDLATDPSYFEGPGPATPTDVCGSTINDSPASFGSSNAGGIASADSFAQWFSDAPGKNTLAPLYLTMTKDSSGAFVYSTSDFTPIDGQMYGNQGAGHNRGFSLALDATATYAQCTGQYFEYAGDGDAWLFVNGKLAMDMGGTHAGGRQVVDLDRLTLSNGAPVRLQFFYAQRSSSAQFSLKTNMVLTSGNQVGPPRMSGSAD